MTTEYEQLLSSLIEQKKQKIAELQGKPGKKKALAATESDLKFIEVELHRYQQGMALFRTKGVPRVGRWGKPEEGESNVEQ